MSQVDRNQPQLWGNFQDSNTSYFAQLDYREKLRNELIEKIMERMEKESKYNEAWMDRIGNWCDRVTSAIVAFGARLDSIEHQVSQVVSTVENNKPSTSGTNLCMAIKDRKEDGLERFDKVIKERRERMPKWVKAKELKEELKGEFDRFVESLEEMVEKVKIQNQKEIHAIMEEKKPPETKIMDSTPHKPKPSHSIEISNSLKNFHDFIDKNLFGDCRKKVARGHQHLSMPEFLPGDVVEVQKFI